MIEQYINKIINADCLNILKQLPSKSIDLVLTDPPYNASNSSLGYSEKSYKTINQNWDKDFTLDFLQIVESKIKDNGSMLVFCSYHLLADYLNTAKLKLQQIIHWAKYNPFPAIAKVYTQNVEYILWFRNTKPYTFNKGFSGQNIIYTNILNGKENNGHPAQKPLELIEKLLNVHSNGNDLILDCFSGSGTTAIACHNLNRNFICIEKDKDYYEKSVKRYEEHIKQLRLTL